MKSKTLMAIFMLLSIAFAVNVLSISKVEILNPGETYDGVNNKFPRKAWLVEAVVTGTGDYWSSGEYLTAGWRTLEDPDENAASEKKVKIDMVPTAQYCRYSFEELGGGDDRQEFVWSETKLFGPKRFWYPYLGMEDWISQYCGCNWDWISRTCKNPTHKITYIAVKPVLGGTGYDVACAWMDRAISPIFAPVSGRREEIFGVKVKVQSADASYEGVITNRNKTGVWLGDRVFAEVVGGLTSGLKCPDVSNWRIIRNEAREMKTVSEATMNDYIKCLPVGKVYEREIVSGGLIWEALKDWFDGKREWSDVEATVRYCNTKRAEVLAGEDLLNPDIKKRLVDYEISESGELKIKYNTLINFPVVRMLIDSDWIKIVVTTPRPRILDEDLPKVKLTTGIPVTVSIPVKNVGKYAGTIKVKLDCGPIYVSPSTVQSHGFQPGETYRFNYVLRYSGTSSATFTCRVTAYAALDPSVKDEATFSAEYTYTGYGCIPGHEWCDGTKIMHCTESRTPIVKYDCARDGKVCAIDPSGKPICVEGYVPPPVPSKTPLWLIGLAIVLILLIFVAIRIYFRSVTAPFRFPLKILK